MNILGREKLQGLVSTVWLDDFRLLLLARSGDSNLINIKHDALVSMKYSFDLAVSCAISIKKKSKFQLLIGTVDGKICYFVIQSINDSFSIEKKASSKKLLKRHVTALKWVPSGKLFISLVGEKQINLHKSNCSVIKKVITLSHSIFHFMFFPNENIFFAEDNQITCINLSNPSKQTQWVAHNDTICVLFQFPTAFLVVAVSGECSLWSEDGKKLWQPSCAVPSVHSLSVTDKYLYSDCIDSIYRLELSTSNLEKILDKATKDVDEEALIESSSRSEVLLFTTKNDDIIIKLPEIKELAYGNMTLSVTEANILRVQFDSGVDDFELVDAKSTIVGFHAEFKHLFIFTITFQLRVVCLDSFSCLGVLSDITFCQPLIVGAQYFCYDGSIYNYSCNLELNLSSDILTHTSSTMALDDNFFLSYTEEGGRKQLNFVDINSKKTTKLEIYDSIEKLVLNNQNCGAFKDILGRVYIFTFGSSDDIQFRGNFVPDCFVDDIIFSETSNTLALLSDTKEKVTFIPCPEVILEPIAFIFKYLVVQSKLYSKKCYSCQSFQNGKVVVQNEKNGVFEEILAIPGMELIFNLVKDNHDSGWVEAERLCFSCNSPLYWAMLCGLAYSSDRISTLRLSLGRLDFILQANYIAKYCEGNTAINRAYYACFKGNYNEAEKILLDQRPSLVSEAVRINIKAFNFKRARELSQDNKDLLKYVSLYEKRFNSENLSNNLFDDIKKTKRSLFPNKLGKKFSLDRVSSPNEQKESEEKQLI